MSVPQILRHPRLIEFHTQQTFSPVRTYVNAIFPNSKIVRNNNQLFIQYSRAISKSDLEYLLRDLLVLSQMAKENCFIKMKYFQIKSAEKSQHVTIIIYLERVGQTLEKYVRMKRSSKNPIISENVLFDHFLSLAQSLNTIQQLGYQRHGHFNFFTLWLDNQKLKVMFNPLFPLTCLRMLDLQPSLQYFEYCFLSPEQLQKLKENEAIVSSKSDVYTIGIIILNLATLHLFQNSCYLPHSRQQACIDKNHIDQKLSYVTEYYSSGFSELLYVVLQEDPDNRITSGELYKRIRDVFEKRKSKEKKYIKTLEKVYGEKGYKGVDYKLKFSKNGEGSMEEIRVTKDVDNETVFRGTFGHEAKIQGQYEIPKQQIQEQDNFPLSKTKEQEETQKKKPNQKTKQSKQNQQDQSSQENKSTSKKQNHKISKQAQTFDPVSLQKQFDEYSADKKKHPQKFKYQVKPDLSIIPEQLFDTFHQSAKPQFHRIDQLDHGVENKQFTICTKLQEFENLMFEVKSPEFQIMMGENAPVRKYFKPPLPNQLIKKFQSKGVMIGQNLYYGNIGNGRRQGIGLQIFPEGDYYYGYFQNDLFHGKGVYWWSPTHYFVGQFNYGKRLHGWMIIESRTYYGSYFQNRKEGKGINFDESEIYEGYWSNGKKEGKGIIYYTNGDTFKGQWKNGKKHGKGIQKRFKSLTQIEAEWENDNLLQPVEVRFSNGHIYRGDFQNNQKSGKGQYIYSDGSRFSGLFKENSCYEGTFQFCDGSIYKGRVNKNAKRQGYGVYIGDEGIKYQGEWRNDMKNGEGILTTDTFVKKGIWRQGQLYQGIIQMHNSSKQTIVKNGEQCF